MDEQNNLTGRVMGSDPIKKASDTYSVLVKDKNIYGSKMLPLPSPTFVVFYNGKQKMDEEVELQINGVIPH